MRLGEEAEEGRERGGDRARAGQKESEEGWNGEERGQGQGGESMGFRRTWHGRLRKQRGVGGAMSFHRRARLAATMLSNGTAAILPLRRLTCP